MSKRKVEKDQTKIIQCWSCKIPCIQHPDRYEMKHPAPMNSYLCNNEECKRYDGKLLALLGCDVCGDTFPDTWYCLGELSDKTYYCFEGNKHEDEEDIHHFPKIFDQGCFFSSVCWTKYDEDNSNCLF